MMGDKGEKSRSFATLPSTSLRAGRMTVIGVGMAVRVSRIKGIGIGLVEGAGADRWVGRVRGKHEGFYHEIGEDVK